MFFPVVFQASTSRKKKHGKFHGTQTFDATHSACDSILCSGQKLELEFDVL